MPPMKAPPSPTGKRFCRDYCRRLRRALHDLPDLQRRLVPQTEEAIWEYLEQNPDADEDELLDRFGLPEQAAMSVIAALEPEELQKRLRRYRRRRLAVWLAVIAALAYAIGSCIKLEISYIGDDGYGVIGPAIVDEGPLPPDTP